MAKKVRLAPENNYTILTLKWSDLTTLKCNRL